ncbi:MAG: DUF255 domain-containing protein [Cytophagales bacterium]|nr:DUF255 domain-containing protein [Cytophagales bacterium]
MKNLHSLAILILFLAVPVFASKPDKKINWISIEEAQTLAQKDPRPIVIDFYTDWCHWCKVFDKTTFKDQKVIDYVNKNFYAVKLNAESKKAFVFKGQKTIAPQLVKKYQIQGYPTIVFLDNKFENHSLSVGYKKGPDFLQVLKAEKGKGL